MNDKRIKNEGISAFLLPWKQIVFFVVLIMGLTVGSGRQAHSFTVEPGDTCIVGVSAGVHTTCILKADGNVDCYGNNGFGQANDYTGRDAIGVSVGEYHTCILKADGNVDCFGYNAYEQANNYTGGDAIGVSAGGNFTCILTANGNVDCYGNHIYDEAKDYSGGDAVSVATGGIHKCVLKTDGNVDCYGFNGNGQANDYTGGDAIGVSAGGSYTCILKTDGNVDCYGSNSYGEADDYTGGDAIGISAGDNHTCILKANGNVECYGNNLFGQAIEYSGGDAIGISAGMNYTCILKADGNVDCTGNNLYGKASDYTNENAACSYHQPEVTTATIDIINDLFQVETKGGQTTREPANMFLEAIIKVKDGYFAWDIDPTTVVLSKNGTMLTIAEEVQVVDNVLMVKFPLNLTNVGIILDMNVNEVMINKGNVKVKADSPPATSVDLINLTISGDIFGGGSFSSTDAICVTH